MTTPITPRQSEALAHITKHIDRHGYAPTTRELADMMDVYQQSASVMILHLIKAGRLKRAHKGGRGIRIAP